LRETTTTEIAAVASVELQVKWPDDDKELPQIIEYTSVEFETVEEKLAQRIALIEMMRGKSGA
jgi:hypothetical protein